MLPVSLIDPLHLGPRFSVKAAVDWFQLRWPLAAYASVVYLALTWIGWRWMQQRPKYRLQRLLVAWNTGLAVFSAMGAIVLFRPFLESMRKGGITEWVCRNSAFTVPDTALWACLFALFKMVELGDTAFIVLRKQRLTFLHCYHHVSVMIYCWYCWPARDPVAHSFMLINLVVHAVMYSYFAVKASGRWVPTQVSQCITILQLSQFVVAVANNLLAFWLKTNGEECQLHDSTFYFAIAMYVSYLVLFVNFFLHRYCK